MVMEMNVAMKAWAQAATPLQLHQLAMSWNWDYGTTPLIWAIRREDCDKGTAYQIFHLGQPKRFLQYKHRGEILHEGDYTIEDLQAFDLLSEIAANWTQGLY